MRASTAWEGLPKEKLRQMLTKVAASAVGGPLPAFEIERPKVQAHGELSTNLAMLLAKVAKKKPVEIANIIVEALKRPENDPEGLLENISVAGGGFINMTLKADAWRRSLKSLVAQGKNFGKSAAHRHQKAVIEFVSAN